MLERLSRSIAIKAINNSADSEADLEVITYGLTNRLCRYTINLFTFLIGFLLGHILEALFALVALKVIRTLSGGVHFKSLTVCAIVTSLFCGLLPLVQLEMEIKIIFTALSLFMYIVWAPNVYEELVVERNDDQLKLFSSLVVASNFYFQSSILTIIFFVQGLTIIKWRR
ncbi:accessory gene regulator B family protein [Paenibacillus agilis]|uniref:Accessory regulator AgrB n=1 Tax=Paenibacillus agilis TaxID=3020863 RepID=A0A559IZL9_9BACL|nr:hypothetical protein FPZ44_08360 [Paenibacillus agilis]